MWSHGCCKGPGNLRSGLRLTASVHVYCVQIQAALGAIQPQDGWPAWENLLPGVFRDRKELLQEGGAYEKGHSCCARSIVVGPETRGAPISRPGTGLTLRTVRLLQGKHIVCAEEG